MTHHRSAQLRHWPAIIPLLLAGLVSPIFAAPDPAVYKLVGNWDSNVEIGKFKIRLVVNISKSADGKLSGKVAIPDQGARDIPVSAILCNYPAVRLEIDPFETAFNGTINEPADQVTGTFEEGPGGRPFSATFRRMQEAGEITRVYTFAPGETHDIRGYWLGKLDMPGGPSSRIGLKVGRGSDLSYSVLLDILDRGALDIEARQATQTNGSFRFEWPLLEIVFEGKLDEDGNKLTGSWRQNKRAVAASFERLDQPATVLPPNVSFTPEGKADIRGRWKGTLDVPNTKLRLVIRIGRTPDGTLAGTLSSLDQGGGELPMSSGSISNQVVKLEWKSINGVFKGSLNQEGTVLDGHWEQMGPPLVLKLERDQTAPAAKEH
jgi:hypothetical protein